MEFESKDQNLDKFKTLIHKPHNIRNVAVFASVDHGRNTLYDSLLLTNGFRKPYQRGDSGSYGSHLNFSKTPVTSLHYELPVYFSIPPKTEGREFLINLIDVPYSMEYSPPTLRISDGVLILVDSVEGFPTSFNLESFIKQAHSENITPIFALNKIDRFFIEFQMDLEDIYQTFSRYINHFNTMLWPMKDIEIQPEKGNICFCSGSLEFGFTINQFARIYGSKFDTPEEKLVDKLWGDHFYDSEQKKWTNSPMSTSKKPLKRGFCQFILLPIYQIMNVCLMDDKVKLEKMISKIGITLSSAEKELFGRKLIKAVLNKWLPLADGILEMCISHFPPPIISQQTKVANLYTGPQNDLTAQSIRKCDPKGPLLMYLIKSIPLNDYKTYFAFGRIFSGTVSCQSVRVMDSNIEHNKSNANVTITQVLLMGSGSTYEIDEVTAGNVCALIGIDNFSPFTQTISTNPGSFPIVGIKMSSAPIVRVAVAPKDPAHLPALVEALKKLSKGDSAIRIFTEESGEFVIGASREIYLDDCLRYLDSLFHKPLVIGNPYLWYQETSGPCGLNQLIVEASPLEEKLLNVIEHKQIELEKEDERKRLEIEFGWEPNSSKNIWAFGPESNLLVNLAKNTEDFKKDIVNIFQYTCKRGILIDEGLRGVQFNIVDIPIQEDSGSGKINPLARKIFLASQLLAKPRIMEPVYLVEIQCLVESLPAIHSALQQRRGKVIETKQMNSNFYILKGFLPVSESTAFQFQIRYETKGDAIPTFLFDHWEMIDDDPLIDGTRSNQIVKDIRKRKALNPTIPTVEQLLKEN